MGRDDKSGFRLRAIPHVPMLIASLVLLVLAGWVAWAYPRPHGDLYLGLAGGRDVLAGGMGAPDTWSFITAGRVWLHQNWGADVVLELARRWGGDTALLALKGLLVMGIAGAMIFAARSRNRGALVMAVLCAGAGLAAWPQGMGLRANLFSLVCTPLLIGLLLRWNRGLRMPLAVVLLMLVWANIHGGFVFGLAIIGLWVLARVAGATRRVGIVGAVRVEAVPIADLALAVVVTGLVNPNGIRNLLLPLRLLSQSEWRTVNEWRSFLEGGIVQYRTPWVFLALGVVVLIGLVIALRSRVSADATREEIWFELMLALTVISMGLRSERFLLFASVILAPLAARRLAAWIKPRRGWVPLVLAGVLLVFMVQEYRWIPGFYREDNPLRPPESVAERMVFAGTHFPTGAATFLARNEISGRVFQEWRWEGYLRWACPELKIFVGGRAHQIYTEADARRRIEIVTAENPARGLAELEVPLAVVPLDAEYGHFVLRLLRDTEHRWAYLYCDRTAAVLVCMDTPLGAELATRATSGKLRYPTAFTASLSVGMHLASPAVRGGPADAFRLLKGAVEREPVFYAYQMMVERGLAGGETPESLCSLLESELRRLEEMPTRVANGIVVVDSRRAAALVLQRLYQSRGLTADVQRAGLQAQRAELEARELRRVWTPPN